MNERSIDHCSAKKCDPSKMAKQETKAPITAHILWAAILLSLIVALYFAYLETISKSALDMLLPRTNITIAHQQNGNTTIKKVPKLARTYRFLRSPDLSCYGDLLGALLIP